MGKENYVATSSKSADRLHLTTSEHIGHVLRVNGLEKHDCVILPLEFAAVADQRLHSANKAT